MPKSIKKELAKKILHPKSRKAQQLSKQTKRISKIEKIKLVHHVKQNLIGEKLLWFRDHLEPDVLQYTPELTIKIIELYLSRFDEELEQIRLKHSIGNRKNRQHANREDIIRLTLLQEKEEFATCGLEIPDLLDIKQLEMLRTWEGELRLLQNFKLKRYNRRHLEQLAKCTKSSSGKSLGKAESSKNKESQNLPEQQTLDMSTGKENESYIKELKVSPNEKRETQEDNGMEVDT